MGYHTPRENFPQVLLIYTLLFAGFIFLMKREQDLSLLVRASIGFRVIFIMAIPNLSNDFYRFIWDGRMIFEGLNPYLYLPELFLQQDGSEVIAEGQELYKGMGSLNGSHYTCYPPVNQFFFVIPALLYSKSLLGSTIVMRLLIIAADLGILWIGRKLLAHLRLPEKSVFLYLLNPFIILEMTGNLHFEGVMIFFLLWSLYLLFTKRWTLSAVVMAISISVKLVPLLFLPLIYKRLGVAKSSLYYLIVIAVSVLLFLPFLSQELVDNFMSSINLYFQNFEFNASIYYIIRAIGYEVRGYNIIHDVGRILPLIVLTAILLLTFVRKNKIPEILMSSMLFAICIYYFLSTTIHPWYVAVPLILSVFTNYRFPLVWSFVVILSYSAYASETYSENLWLVGIEYIVVYGMAVKELFFSPKAIDGPIATTS